MKQPTIGIISATYKRPEITEIWVYGIDRLRKAMKEEFPVVVTGDNHPLFKSYDIEFYEQKNEPVSEKFNTSLREMVKHNPKYIMVLGSDNLVHSNVFKDLLEEMEGHDYGGFQWVYYYSLEPDTAGWVKEQYSSIVVGAGRTFSLELYERCKNKNLWSKPMNKSLDRLMFSNLQPYIRTPTSHPGYVIDIKSETNLNPFGTWKGIEKSRSNWMFDLFSKKERSAIRKLKRKAELKNINT